MLDVLSHCTMPDQITRLVHIWDLVQWRKIQPFPLRVSKQCIVRSPTNQTILVRYLVWQTEISQSMTNLASKGHANSAANGLVCRPPLSPLVCCEPTPLFFPVTSLLPKPLSTRAGIVRTRTPFQCGRAKKKTQICRQKPWKKYRNVL